ncbi:efflux RND transporter periplasmic adaptor subunit [Methylosinus sp. Ce-a6]|uniref:efflux RND transporter periplasmic adaptor subunit n=1 Tax=Methylosinus sp. Ce-a6 TaxID=2172005 RepID=UPI00135BF722|nr:efflux RND transporter periplasmic adaptor subunit [Methylosinus sp. Ce-a6]
MRRKAYLGVTAGVAALAAAGWLATKENGAARAGAAPTPAIPVMAGIAAVREVPAYVRGIGTVQAYNTVVVKSRVDGHITRVSFEEGQEVEAGQLLFEIDPRPSHAALAQLEAAKQRDFILLRAARRDLERYAKLVDKAFQSRQSYDNQKATVEQLESAIRSDEAQIEQATLNLIYADICSPIAGRAGARLMDRGNLVQASQGTPLVTITQVKPIYVSFTAPQDWLGALRRNQEASPLAVLTYTSDNRQFLSEGKLSLIDNRIDTASGTVHLKAVFENADERLWPGEFVSVRVVLETRKNIVTVPAEAVMQGPNGPYVYVIQPDGTVERRPVQLTETQEGIALIEKGLSAGQQVVTQGQYRLTNGSRIRVESSRAPLG